jgi:anti-sigma factor RsiW
MNCRGWNPHIALFVEGDLEPNLVQQLEAHIKVCDECRTFVDELRYSQDGVRQLKGEIVDTAVLNRVRGRVLEQVRTIERRRTWMDRAAIWLWGGFRWRYAVLGGIALILSALGVWRVTVVNKPTPSVTQVASTPAVVPSVSVPAPNQTENGAARPRRLKPAPTPINRIP